MGYYDKSIVIIVFLIQLVYGTNLIHFYVTQNEAMCFYKDLNEGVMLHGKYKLEVEDGDLQQFVTPHDRVNTGMVIDVYEVFSGNKRLIHIKGKSSGRFTFDTLASGEHKICITPKSFFKKWGYGGGNDPYKYKESKFRNARVSVALEVGDLYSPSSHTGEVKKLNERINKLNDKMLDIKREQMFIREREEMFRDLSELTNERVVNWTLVQCGALVFTGLYQLLTLKRFFVKEKMS